MLKTFERLSECQHFYFFYLCQWKVVVGRNIDFTSLKGSHLDDLVSRTGWLPLVRFKEPVYPSLIQVFFTRA